MRISLYCLVLLATSCLLSLFILFKYKSNDQLDPRKDFPYEIQNEEYCSYKYNTPQCILFNTMNIFNRFLNDIFFFILNLIIDFLLIKHFNRNLDKKSMITTTTTTTTQSEMMSAASADDSEISKKKQNLNHMVLTNGLVYLMSHLPEFLVTLVRISFEKKIAHFCTEKLSCDLINQEAEVFTLISIVSQLYIFLWFNKNFQLSRDDLIDKLKKNIYH